MRRWGAMRGWRVGRTQTFGGGVHDLMRDGDVGGLGAEKLCALALRLHLGMKKFGARWKSVWALGPGWEKGPRGKQGYIR